jgi:nucleoid-associated protein YgaU
MAKLHELDEQGRNINPENAGGGKTDPTLRGFQHVRSQEPRKYVTQKGDTLESISKTLYGSDARAEEIYEANKALIPDRNQLPGNLEIKIPE